MRIIQKRKTFAKIYLYSLIPLKNRPTLSTTNSATLIDNKLIKSSSEISLQKGMAKTPIPDPLFKIFFQLTL